jgi:hypothetical protein
VFNDAWYCIQTKEIIQNAKKSIKRRRIQNGIAYVIILLFKKLIAALRNIMPCCRAVL